MKWVGPLWGPLWGSLWGCSVFLSIVFCNLACSQEIVASQKESRFQKILKGLDADEFINRRRAYRELDALGISALGDVKKAMNDEGDPPNAEVRESLSRYLDTQPFLEVTPRSIQRSLVLNLISHPEVKGSYELLRELRSSVSMELFLEIQNLESASDEIIEELLNSRRRGSSWETIAPLYNDVVEKAEARAVLYEKAFEKAGWKIEDHPSERTLTKKDFEEAKDWNRINLFYTYGIRKVVTLKTEDGEIWNLALDQGELVLWQPDKTISIEPKDLLQEGENLYGWIYLPDGERTTKAARLDQFRKPLEVSFQVRLTSYGECEVEPQGDARKEDLEKLLQLLHDFPVGTDEGPNLVWDEARVLLKVPLK